MQACRICFQHRGEGEEAVYIAPDLLPDSAPERVEEIWAKSEPDLKRRHVYPIDPGFIMRSLICEVGERLGCRANIGARGCMSMTRTPAAV